MIQTIWGASMLSKKFSFRDEVLASVMLITVIGSLTLAVIDEKSRSQFLDLTKFTIGTYIELLIPRLRSNDRDRN
ncbi:MULTISPECIES: hypothetical protein [unclassified Nostoc]|uniref:hypothetical protein n=1 Tax=unclassified Nostoc TaxID=2593658 RepID=UPI002AD58AFB|nr:hypothetical protein [Nostoc sp. DedQUE04]